MNNLILTIILFLIKINILHTEKFQLDINPMSPISWISKEDIFVNEDTTSFVFNVKNRSIVKEYQKKGNQLLGFKKNKTYFCEWENREIDSPEEFSTHLRVEEIDNREIINIELKPTVDVIECSKEPILKTVFPIEEKSYIFKNELYEINKYNEKLLSPNLKRFITIDDFNKYWIEELRIF